MKSTSQWVDGFKSFVDNGRKHAIAIDLPENQNGSDLGATALELAVMALSGCISTIFAVVASNSNLAFSSLKVVVDAGKGEKTIESAGAKVYVKTDDEKKAARVLEKTMGLCPVGLLYEKAGVQIKTELISE
jgi:uncharacterized OsmC-like protein